MIQSSWFIAGIVVGGLATWFACAVWARAMKYDHVIKLLEKDCQIGKLMNALSESERRADAVRQNEADCLDAISSYRNRLMKIGEIAKEPIK